MRSGLSPSSSRMLFSIAQPIATHAITGPPGTRCGAIFGQRFGRRRTVGASLGSYGLYTMYVVRSVVRFSSAPLALHPSCALCAGMDLDALLAGEADAEELSGALEPKLSRALLGLSDACTQTTSLIAWRSQQRHRQTRCWTRSQRRASYRRRLTQCTRDSRGLQHRRAAEAQAGHGRSDRRVSIAQRRDAFRSDCPPHSSEATLLAGAGAEHRHTHL